MFNTQLKQQLAACQQQLAEAQARREAVDRSMAVIEFQPDGTIVAADIVQHVPKPFPQGEFLRTIHTCPASDHQTATTNQSIH